MTTVSDQVPPSPLLLARRLTLGYGGPPVVRNLDLVIHPGEIVSMLGANGAGKTTSLLGLAGELVPMSGTLSCLGESGFKPLHARARRGLSFVPEGRSVIFSLTVIENLRLGRGPVEKALDLAPELKKRLHCRAGVLSGGEQQILALARALASDPKLLLADELSFGLAPLAADRLLSAVRQAADGGIGVLMVEQHLGSALAVSDRCYVLQRGRVTLEGGASELRGRMGELRSSYLGDNLGPHL
jgi:branched-chain amino acid transport system ATP-binding protein